ncbi:LysM peptidoglycan-binding domain-containing protein [Massilia sp. CCM 8734]|uniref:LysM peptidoglycan-binding domain-containing protein n=1 Tax=Massilia sp. CCM 8734 TaxID=2609283 RepID=UPI00141F17E3|nr:LysM peptidoglycan-binding domain-containing protein [Massilia sp. CCM 8734]NHZ95199.1 peptidoglycan-binding protein [Massilia sp. CCM 8734]
MSYEQWQDGIVKGAGTAPWDFYDCDIQAAVNEYNSHLSGTPGYQLLDWQLIKAMVWTESGAGSREWKIKPMRIGVPGDDGMKALLGNDEGGDLIMPAPLRARLNSGSIRTIPAHNIRAGIGYLLMRTAKYAHKRQAAPDARVEETKAGIGDTFETIARKTHSTVELLRELNPGLRVVTKDTVVKYQKTKVQKIIVGWRVINSSLLYERYNGRGDPLYARKIDFTLERVREVKGASCPT